MPKELKNCESCGRDTVAKAGVCARCIGLGRPQGFAQINDTKDRPVLLLEIDKAILDDLEYTNFYKTNSPPDYCDDGCKSTERFVKRQNKKQD